MENDASLAGNLFFQIDPAWSPAAADRVREHPQRQALDIYVMNANGSDTTLLGTAPGGASHPSWSPDGKQIVFGGANHVGLYLMNADGSALHRIGKDSAKVAFPAWSPKGNWIAFSRTAPNTPITGSSG